MHKIKLYEIKSVFYIFAVMSNSTIQQYIFGHSSQNIVLRADR